MKLIREVNKKKLVKLAKPRDLILGYKLSEVINPINPLLIQRGDITDKELELLKQWGSVLDSVRGSVWDSVWGSVLDSVLDSVWGTVRDSVWLSELTDKGFECSRMGLPEVWNAS